VVAADGQADLAVGLEAARGRHKTERGRAQRVGRGQDDAAVVDAVRIDRVGRPSEGKVPFKEVGFERGGGEVSRGRRGEFLCLADWRS
jgi:hypothetical protein